MKKVYFAGAIRAGRHDVEIYKELINMLKKSYIVLTEHIADINLVSEKDKTEEYIYNRDKAWLIDCDYVVAEVSTPSLGVGYELAFAESLNKKIICLYRPSPDKRLSAMIAGNKNFKVIEYKDASIIDEVVKELLK